jgi:hypothetical protein
MREYTLFIGGASRCGRPLARNEYGATLRQAAELFGGATAIPADGSYRYRNGEVVLENSLIIKVVTDDHDKVMMFAEGLRILLNQEEILVESVPVEEDLVV